MMRCERVLKMLDAYVDSALSERDARSIASHLQYCPNCRQKWKEAQNLKQLLDDAFSDFNLRPSMLLEARIEREICAKQLVLHRQVNARRSAVIFAVAALTLIWLIIAYLHRLELPSTSSRKQTIETLPEVALEMREVKPTLSPHQQGEKAKRETESSNPHFKQLAGKQIFASAKLHPKSMTEKKVRLAKSVSKQFKRNKLQETEQTAEMSEELPRIPPMTEAQTLLVRVERILPLNPANPIPVTIVYRVLNTPVGREGAIAIPYDGIIQPVSVAEIPVNFSLQP